MIFFTICARNFLSYAETLRITIQKHHPLAKFYLVLCDDTSDIDINSFPYPILTMNDLGIIELESMKTRYNITELNTSLKPFAFLEIFDRHPGENVIYMDPDIYVVSPLEELSVLLAGGAECVLTPHITEPAEYADMNDYKFINYGMYNLGFCALKDTHNTRRTAAWWARRLETDCLIDLSRGIFVDQKWADYFPSFIEKTEVLRDPGYNIAYWNLSQRKIDKIDGQWLVNNRPMRFFHFSGNKIEDIDTFTRHSGQFNLDNTPILAALLDEYRNLIYKNGHSYYSGFRYAFSWTGATGVNEHTPESYRRLKQENAVPHLPLLHSQTKSEFLAARNHADALLKHRTSAQIECTSTASPFETDGYCIICRAPMKFQTSDMYSVGALPDGRPLPNWREHLNCIRCGVVNRTRGALHVLEQEFGINVQDNVYITEYVTPLFKILANRWPLLSGSEFLSSEHVSGTVIDGIRHEDIQNSSYPDDEFDLILSFDVLEHVPFIKKAFQEIFRCLKPGARFLFTVPFSYDHEQDVVRASLRCNGEIEHHLTPEYHGNPVDPDNGSLCFRYFGWSVVEDLHDVGFIDAEVISYWSYALMHLGDPQFVITARKPFAPSHREAGMIGLGDCNSA